MSGGTGELASWLESARYAVALTGAGVSTESGIPDFRGDEGLWADADPMQVAAIGRAVLEGLAAGGVAGCIKHMPGHGRTDVDTHKALPTVTASAAELENDLFPFHTLNHALIGMTGHLVFTAWDAENPATLSETVIRDVIRGQIGFDGLLLTDDIDMEALGGNIPERAARAHAAGCDIILNCWAKMQDMQGICNVLTAMSETTAARLDRALAGTRIAPAIAPEAAELLAKRDALLALTGTPA